VFRGRGRPGAKERRKMRKVLAFPFRVIECLAVAVTLVLALIALAVLLPLMLIALLCRIAAALIEGV
jgi:hypothetical protein